MTNEFNQLIVGYGEVGKGLAEVLKQKSKVWILDPYKGLKHGKDWPKIFYAIHICIPFNTNFLKAVKDLSDLVTIKFISSAGRPLIFFSGLAFLLWFLAFISAGTSIIMKLADYRNFGQTPLPLLATLFFISGLILFAMGFLAELLLRIYYESKNTTPYVIKEIIEK